MQDVFGFVVCQICQEEVLLVIFFVAFEVNSLSLIDKFEYVPKHLIHLLLISASMLTYYLES